MKRSRIALRGESAHRHECALLHKRWQKIFLSLVVLAFVVVIITITLIVVIRLKAVNNLKPEEQRITYNGKEYKYRENVINILCLGIDKAEPIGQMEVDRGNLGMADAILLVSIDTKQHILQVISIPRDTVADVQMTFEDGSLAEKFRMQLCYQYAYGRSMEQGNELTVDAVSRLLYNIQIQRCCTINFEALPILNDAIGGVDVVIQEEGMDVWKPDLFVYGEKMHLDGDLALRFIRTRNKNRLDGAVLRANRQKQYALAFVEKAKSVVKKNPFIPIKMFQELQKDGNMCTDITIEDIICLMPEVLKVSFTSDLMYTIPGESSVGEDKYPEYHMEVDTVKELIVNTFYEEVDGD